MNSTLIAAQVATAVSLLCVVCASHTFSRREKYNILALPSFDFDSMVNDDRFNAWFETNLRCSQASFRKLVALLQNTNLINTTYSLKHSFEKKIAMFLFYVGSEGGFREVSVAYGVSKAWSIMVIHAISQELVQQRDQWIHFPSTRKEWSKIERTFMAKKGLPGVAGAVDGTLINIQRPEDYDGFYDRHGDPSFSIQAVCDANCIFMSVDIRPGSFSDKKIWKVSWLGRSIRRLIPVGSYILVDAGYTLLPWLITPFLPHEEGGNLTKLQRDYNFKHSSTRMSIERAFGLLKERFRILKSTMKEKTIESSLQIVMSCFVLHNMLLELKDSLYIDKDVNGFTKSHCQALDDNEDCVDNETNTILRIAAKQKRMAIARYLYD